MSKSPNHKVNLARGAQLLMLLSIGCSGEGEVTPEVEASLESALRTLDSDDIVISYYEGSSSMEIRVDLDPFAELARGFTVEMNVDVKLPDGTVTRHELGWMSGDDLEVPRLALPAAERGRYEVTLTSLAIDGRTVLDAPAPLRSMELLEEGSLAAQELQALARGDGLKFLVCKWHKKTIHGTPGDDSLYGGKGTIDSIHGYEGNDILRSGKCSDNLWGDAGDDVLKAGSDDDTCYGGPGADHFESCEIIMDE